MDELRALYPKLPLAIKPAIKEHFFYATGAKAWRCDTPEQLDEMFARAGEQLRPEEILLQEVIPGDGRRQYSYCAFVRDGEIHSSMVARRSRQHPAEFGRAATYVESIEHQEVEELSERFLKAINYYGLVEIEYKEDPRDGKFKLLDVNARTWGFHSLGAVAGVDFPYLLFADQMGLDVAECRGTPGVGWMRVLTDVPTACSDLFARRIDLATYFKSLRSTGTEAVFSWKDPLPFLAEAALLPYLVLMKYKSLM